MEITFSCIATLANHPQWHRPRLHTAIYSFGSGWNPVPSPSVFGQGAVVVIVFNVLRTLNTRPTLFCSFACGYKVSPASFVEDTICSPFCILGPLIKNQLTVYARLYFRAPRSVPLVYTSVCMLVPHCFYSCSFVVYFSNQEAWWLQLVVVVVLSWSHFGYSWSFVDPHES